MTPTSKFEILRRKDGQLNRSIKLTSAGLGSAAGTVNLKRGTAIGASLTDSEAGVIATGTNFLGFLARNLAQGGLQLSDRIFGMGATGSGGAVGPEAPFVDGEEVSLENAAEIECEGPDYLYSGTGQINQATAVGTRLSFIDGKLRQVQSNEVAYFTLTANNLELNDSTVSGELRIRAVAVA
jgi:hypothetical protein